MKRITIVIRAIAILLFLFLMQTVFIQISQTARQTYDMMPYMVILSLGSILFGALLRSDVFFQKNKAFKPDWLSLVIIGLPSILITFTVPILFFFPEASLPGFVSILFMDEIRLFSGVVAGYTIVNSLFTAKNS